MQRFLTRIFFTLLLSFASGHSNVAEAGYMTIWGWNEPKSVQLTQPGWDSEYVLETNYRVAKIDWNITNPASNTESYREVRFVVPFSWGDFQGVINPKQRAYTWDNTAQEWTYYNVGLGITSGVDGNDDGLYFKAYADSQSPDFSYLPMNSTDIPTSRSYTDYETATVQVTDSVLAYDVASLLDDYCLDPGDSISFSTYIEIERRTAAPALSSYWTDVFVVTPVPIPGAALLYISGCGLFGWVAGKKHLKKRLKPSEASCGGFST